MTDISLSPEAVEVQAPPDLEFPELAPDAAEVDQYAGLTPLEAAAAKTHPHISMCRLGWTRMDCVTCADELHQIRKYIPALALVIEADARADERRKLYPAVVARLLHSAAWHAPVGLADPAEISATDLAIAEAFRSEAKAWEKAGADESPVAAASNPTDTAAQTQREG